MLNYSYIALIPLIPLVIFVILGIWGRKYIKKWSGVLATLGLLISTILAVYTSYNYFFVAGTENGVYQPVKAFNVQWLDFSPGLSIDMSVLLDPVSVMMLVVVTFIS